jgi:hypothetical protein
MIKKGDTASRMQEARQLARQELPPGDLLFHQHAPGVELQQDLDGNVTSLLPDEDFAAEVGSFPFSFAELGGQVMAQVYPRPDHLAAAVAPHRDRQRTVAVPFPRDPEKAGEFFDELHDEPILCEGR